MDYMILYDSICDYMVCMILYVTICDPATQYMIIIYSICDYMDYI